VFGSDARINSQYGGIMNMPPLKIEQTEDTLTIEGELDIEGLTYQQYILGFL
jgi:hypothetical protein